jgi:hypothetical protein
MRKVKIMQSTSWVDHYSNPVFFPAAGDWQEVNDKEYQEIRMAVQYANQNNKDTNCVYQLVEYSDEITQHVYASATAFKEEMKLREKAEKKRKAADIAKRKAATQKRKRTQLEKLKAELGEE